MESLLIVVICGAVGGIVYLLFVLTSGLASHILGDKIQRLPVLGKLIKRRDVTHCYIPSFLLRILNTFLLFGNM